MAGTLNIFAAFEEHRGRSTVDCDSDQLYLVLLKNTYTPNLTGHSVLADLTLASNEITPGGGYPANGVLIGTFSIARAGNTTTYDLPDFTLTAVGGAIPVWRYYAIYFPVTRNGVTNPLFGYGLGNDAGGGTDVTEKLEGASNIWRWNPSGVWRANT